MNEIEDIIDVKDEVKLKISRSISPRTPPPSAYNPTKLTNSQNVDINQPPNPTDLPPDNNPLDAITKAKNTIAFIRALDRGYFRNVDPSYYVVIMGGRLISICENEMKARQEAVATINGDGMVFPISGNFKSNQNK
ncbi:8123_t:CDS:2 [Funneliformis geosporum]|uniref:15362_t:CDS:1 n=1 Tax=Funneliformis geosporum TaxID=1117311 RepID=A0A9W4WRX3_9GLOM|nr:8123_t:CDS:2 [Funneliformis geosporum]CAI2167511.1 15362_t:CDS:2 [Funneliformis geosporum]